MTLSTCMELGKACGLTTLESCILNVELHATSLFRYDKIHEELQELYRDVKEKEPEYFKEHFKEG